MEDRGTSYPSNKDLREQESQAELAARLDKRKDRAKVTRDLNPEWDQEAEEIAPDERAA